MNTLINRVVLFRAVRLFSLSVALAGCYLAAQSVPNWEVGYTLFGSFHGSNVDQVNLNNRKVELDIPLVSYPQRGGKLHLGFHIRYHSPVFTEKNDCYPIGPENSNICANIWHWDGPPHVEVDDDISASVGGSMIMLGNVPEETLSVGTADGSSHMLGNVNGTIDQSNGGQASLWESTDGSGFRFQTMSGTDSGVLTDNQGTRYNFSTNVIEDANGNQINWINTAWTNTTAWTDTIGRQIPRPPPGAGNIAPFNSDGTGCVGPLPIYAANAWTIPAYGGGTVNIKFCYAQVNIQLQLGQKPPNGFPEPADPSGTYALLQSIILPNGQAFIFQYDNGGWGDLTQITLPAGGTIGYSSNTFQGCVRSPQPGGAFALFSRGIVTRTVNDGTGNQTWSYSGGNTNNGATSNTVTVTDPLGNNSVHNFTALSNTCSFYETETDLYELINGTQTPLKRVITTYSSEPDPNFNGGNDVAINVLPQTITTQLANGAQWTNGQTSEITKKYDNGFPVYGVYSGATANYGSVILEQEYDYGPGSPPSVPLRQTQTTFQWQANSNFLTYNNLTAPYQVYTLDSQGGTAALTTYLYDGNSLGSSGITLQHDPNPGNGAPGYVRGNATTITRYLANGTSPSTSNTWFDTGELAQTKDALQNPINYSYDPAYQGAYLTETCYPQTTVAHCVSGTYDFNSGLLTSFTGENASSQASGETPGDPAHTTTYSYDNLLRPVQALSPPDPLNGNLQAQTNFYYPNATTIERTRRQDSSSLIDEYYYLDGLGRTTKHRLIDPENNVDTDTAYDPLGRVLSASNPYRSTSDPTYGVTCHGTLSNGQCTPVNGYDSLGRPLTITNPDGTTVVTSYIGRAAEVQDEGNGHINVSRISQSDALGRLTAVCEVSTTTLAVGSDQPGNCGLDIAGTGFLTSYNYDTLGNLKGVTQGSLSSRGFLYDTLSRLTSATNPETGTTTYSYDANSNLYQRIRPTANQTSGTTTTTYSYDALNRLTDVTYNDGTTPSEHFRYDESSPFGITASNPIGEKTSEYTDAGTGATFSYDVLGRAAKEEQCISSTCSSASNFLSLTGVYNAIGGLVSFSDGAGVSYNFTYTPAGRLSQITDNVSNGSMPSTLISSISHAPGGQLLSASLGNGVTDERSYDHRQRITAGSAWNQEVVTQGAPATGSVTFSAVSGGGVQSTQVLVSSATPSTDTVSIGGSEQHTSYCPIRGKPCITEYNTGTVTVTVNGYSESASYAEASTGSSIASALYTAFQNDGNAPVTVSNLNGASFTITSKATGSSANYSLSSSASYYTQFFSASSFTASFSPAGNMTGGANATYTTVYDSGTISLTVQSSPPVTETISYANGDTAQSVASRMQAQISNDGSSPITASIDHNNSAMLDLQSKALSASADYGLQVSYTYNTTYFSEESFPASLTNLSGGKDPVSGTVPEYSYTVTYNPDSTLQSSTDTVNSNWTYAYDDFNRLSTAVATNGNGCQEVYDRFGNRWQQNQYNGSCPSQQMTFSGGTNRIDGGNYDGAGNLLSWFDGYNHWSYTYDAESRLTQVMNGSSVVATYVYDAEGRRARKTTSAGTLNFVYDLSGHEVTELNSGNWTRDEIYAGGEHLATYMGGTTYFTHSDWLGNERARSHMDSNIYETWTNLPFGEGLSTPNPGPTHFTGKDRDAESGNDYFGARYYPSSMGRWLSPEWSAKAEPIPYATLDNPQSLDLYVYVGNDPLIHIDADGHCAEHYQDGSCKVTVDPSTGDAGAKAGKQLEGVLNKYDKAVNAVKDDAKIDVKDSKGNVVGSITGKELKAVWNGTSFTVTDKTFNNGGAGGGTSGTWKGDSFSGRSELNPKAVAAYADTASARSEVPDVGVSTLTFHELGHETHFGEALTDKYPVTPTIAWPREQGTSSAGKSMAGAAGAPFDCSVVGGGCQ